jgi:predicted regulator of Ras-like GTPase activity (Roadblock/LC7/MglB family)
VPFQYLLTNLLVDVPGAQGAIFLDPEGEAVEFVSRNATPYELKLEGAYHAIFLRQAARLAKVVETGELERLMIAGSQIKVLSRSLRAGYYLVLIVDRATPVSVAGEAMKRTARSLDAEIP